MGEPSRLTPSDPAPTETEGQARGQPGDFYWHVHHETLCEMLTEPLQNRIDYIKWSKDPSEVGLRLKLLTPVLHPERLPSEWEEADQKWEEAYQKHLPELEALHKEEHPDCPWNGETIFA